VPIRRGERQYETACASSPTSAWHREMAPPGSDCFFLRLPRPWRDQKRPFFNLCKRSSPQAIVSGVPHWARSAYAWTLCYPQKIVDIVLARVYSSRGYVRCVHPCCERMAPRLYDATDGRGVCGMERMAAKTVGVRVNHTASPGLVAGRDVDQYSLRRLTAPLARELVRYTVAGGLASLVDMGLLVVLTRGLGVYYLHAAIIAFSVGLLTSYGLSVAWMFEART
jgi:GtrA-like protein